MERGVRRRAPGLRIKTENKGFAGSRAQTARLCPYNGVNSKIVLYLFLGGTALSGIKKSNLNLTMSKSMLGCASQAGTSGESATCHLAAA